MFACDPSVLIDTGGGLREPQNLLHDCGLAWPFKKLRARKFEKTALAVLIAAVCYEESLGKGRWFAKKENKRNPSMLALL